MGLTASERETTIQIDDASAVVYLWSAQRPVIRRVLADPRWTTVEAGEDDGSPWISATCQASDWNPLTGMKKRVKPMSEEQRQAAAARLAKARTARTEGDQS